jgi:hypothetical protein
MFNAISSHALQQLFSLNGTGCENGSQVVGMLWCPSSDFQQLLQFGQLRCNPKCSKIFIIHTTMQTTAALSRAFIQVSKQRSKVKFLPC